MRLPEPASPAEADKAAHGEAFLTRDGRLYLARWRPPAQRHRFRCLDTVPGPMVGRRVLWQAEAAEVWNRGWYVVTEPVLGSQVPGVSEASAGDLFVRLVPEETWWRYRLLGETPPKRAAVALARVWLDEAEG